MAFGINDKVVETPTTGFGVNDKVVEAPTVSFGVNDTVVAKATAPTEKPPEDLTKPAFLAPRQRATALQERAATIRQEEAQKIPFDALWKDDKNFKVIQDYASARFGKEGVLKQGETKEDFVNRFATHMKRLDFGNELNSVGELQYLNNAKQEDILKAGAAYDLFKNTAGVFDEQNRGQKGFRPVMDAISSIVSSPSTALTLGVGKIASSGLTKLVAEKGTKAALTSARGAGMAAATPTVGGATAASQDVTGQKIELNVAQAELSEAKKIDPATLDATGQAQLKSYIDERQKKLEEGVSGKRAALAGAIGAVTETAEVLPFLRGAGKGKTSQLDDILKDRKKPAVGEPTTPAPKVEVTAKDSTGKAVEDSFDIFDGRKLLDAQGNPTSVAQMEVRNDLNKRATLIAQDIWKQMPEFAPQKSEKVSDAVKRTLESVDTFDDVVFERALAASDTTPDEFAKMFRTSVGDAARSLQSLSVVARLQNKLRSIDPAAASELNKMYGDRSSITDSLLGIKDLGMRLDRELKALMVSQLSTTVRNAFSGVSVITFGTASEAIESALYRMGKTVGELSTGKPVTGSFTGGLKGVYDDAVRSAFYLGQRDLSAEVTESLLSGTPALYRKMVKTVGEAGPNDLSKAAQIANTFNVAQDSFFRKAMFTSSVEKQLSRVGINMYDVIAQNKQVPFDVLQNAVNEALTGTFSKMPTRGPMYYGVKFIEELGPIGSTVIPFPRFMANAMEWTFKHMPTGALYGSSDIAVGLTKMAKGDADMGTKQVTRGLENFSKGAVGTAALYAAYKYREENQDTEWYNAKNPDGSTVDTRALFPAAPFLALADYLVKFNKGRTDEFKAKEFLEAMTGFKAPAGTYSWIGDKFAEAQANAATGEDTADNKVKTFFGEWMGEYFGRALVPLQQVSDIIGAIDRNETLPRDAYQIPAGQEGMLSSATNQLMKRTPVLKQELPVYQPPLRETAAFNDSGPLKMFSGIAIKGTPSELEEEVIRLKVPGNKIFTSTGDKIVDADARKIMAPLVVQQFDNLKKTSFYQEGSQDLQKIALQNLIGWAQKSAKEQAIDKSTAVAYAKEEQPRLYEIQYSKLSPELKRVVNETYKKQQGKDLATTKDYATALAYAEVMRDLPNYAHGGVVHMSVGGIAAKELVSETAKAGVKKGALSLGEIVAKHSITPAVEQTAQALATPVVEGAASAMAKKPYIKNKYSPAVSEPKPVDVEMEKLVTEAESAFKPAPKVEPEVLPEIKTELPVVEMTPYQKELSEINLNKPKFGTGLETRQNTLSALKDLRTDSFDKLIEMPNVAGKIEDDVIAVAQGEYRAAKGKEVDVNDPKSVEDFVSFSMPLQKKLDDLRVKYKDRPPVTLYHGTETNADDILKKGFTDPQNISDTWHTELNIGATSFTKDIRFNLSDPRFGGKEPANILETKIPYADYEFRRINMPMEQYRKSMGNGDMNTIARSITGSPTVARPLGIPRSLGLKETEDAFTESEKLAISRNMRETEKKIPLAEQQDKVKRMAMYKLQSIKDDFLNPETMKPVKEGGRGSEEVQALNAYRTLRSIIRNEFRETGGAAALKAGETPIIKSSQTTAGRLKMFAKNQSDIYMEVDDFIPKVINTLEKVGSKDKAEALKVLENQFKVLRKYNVGMETPSSVLKDINREEIKAVDAIRDLVGGTYRDKETKKRIGLARGGLASRR
jgi:hypothetical protein